MPTCNHCVPQNCEFAQWGKWYDAGGCTGLCFRHRALAQPNNECGRPCSGVQEDTKPCFKTECGRKPEEDAMFGSWSEWGLCDSGQRDRHREVATQAAHGGRSVEGPLREVQPCGQGHVVDCEMNQWNAWTTCSCTCGQGWHTRDRRIIRFSANGGKPCVGSTREEHPCNEQPCNGLACQFSPWSSWAGCDGYRPFQRDRHRRVEQPGSNGAGCSGTTHEMEGCTSHGPSDCVISQWDQWSSCDKHCDGGQQVRHRKLIHPAHSGGTCPQSKMKQIRGCNTQSCHSNQNDCILSPWRSWSACTAQCEDGVRKREREVLQRAGEGGRGCSGVMMQVVGTVGFVEWLLLQLWRFPQKVEENSVIQWTSPKQLHVISTDASSTAPMPGGQNGSSGPNARLPVATASSFDIEAIKCRQIPVAGQLQAVARSGTSAKVLVLAVRCAGTGMAGSLPGMNGPTAAALASAFVSDRGLWSNTTSGTESQPIPFAPLKQIQPCHPGPRELAPSECVHHHADCKLSQWNEWTECPVTCGGGNKMRLRYIFTPASNNGRPCEAALRETTPCATNPCGEGCVDCLWGHWSEWGACSKCGDQRFRQRDIMKLANHCGKRCEARDAKEVSNCTSQCDSMSFCVWKPWTSWSGCSADCGPATRLRERSLGLVQSKPNEYLFKVAHDSYAGLCAGTQTDTEACPTRPCDNRCVPTDCTFSPWGEWHQPSCIGLCTRSRSIAVVNNECGEPCHGPLVSTKRCLEECTEVLDCEFRSWSHWSQMDRSGPGALRYRSREVSQMPRNGGKPCEGDIREVDSFCEENDHLQHCRLIPWSDWVSCSKTCGGGWQLRTRAVAQPARNGGQPCQGDLSEGQTCAEFPCQEGDCVLAPWSSWGDCWGGQRTRSRRVQREATAGGRPCGGPGSPVLLGETRPCSQHGMDCQVSAWSAWDSCDKSCGGGEQQRHRQVQVYPMHGGLPCPTSLRELRACGSYSCGTVDCEATAWTEWGACSVQCGAGQQQRDRQIARSAQGEGRKCNFILSETRACRHTGGGSMPGCGMVNCLWGDWSSWSGCTCSCGAGLVPSLAAPQYGQQFTSAFEQSPHPDIDMFYVVNVAAGGGQRTRNRHIAQSPQVSLLTMLLTTGNIRAEVADAKQSTKRRSALATRTAAQRLPAAMEPGASGRSGHPALPPAPEVYDTVIDGWSTRPMNAADLPKDSRGMWPSWLAWAVGNHCWQRLGGEGDERGKEFMQSWMILDGRRWNEMVHGRGRGEWCVGATKETSPCAPSPGAPAPIACQPVHARDCIISQWSSWGQCDVTCGGGQSMRERSVDHEARDTP
ncbi:SPON1 [Symbiodinium sp. CCMP2592]|nr:SPON1 [Symbiodinium sp. CCMP2592]